MFGPSVPSAIFREHDWRNDVVTIGEVPAEIVTPQAVHERPDWIRPARLNCDQLVETQPHGIGAEAHRSVGRGHRRVVRFPDRLTDSSERTEPASGDDSMHRLDRCCYSLRGERQSAADVVCWSDLDHSGDDSP